MEPTDLDFESPTAVAEPPDKSKLSFIEYDAPNGDKWRVERAADLINDFELDESAEALPKWHKALCGQEPAWTILCRTYGNAPLYGVEDPDELRAWTIAELAEKRGVEPREIDAHVQGARTYWRQWRLREDASPDTLRPRSAPDDETAETLLREHGFGEIENKEERSYIATRIQELQPYLDSDNLRSAARSLVQQEVGMFFILDPTIRELRDEIHRKLTAKSSAEKENKQLLDLLKERRDAQEAHNSSLKMLGLTDGQGGGLRKKLAFNDCLSTCVSAFQKYYAEGERDIIDGVFTAAEVELLTTPTKIRPAQYRPDLIVSIAEAKEHLWEAEWSGTPLVRRACRKLKKGFAQGLAEARSDEGEVMSEEAAEEEEISEPSAGETSATAPFEAQTNLQSLPRASTADETAALIT